jgi:hypothetical protein
MGRCAIMRRRQTNYRNVHRSRTAEEVETRQFEVSGLEREYWKGAPPRLVERVCGLPSKDDPSTGR